MNNDDAQLDAFQYDFLIYIGRFQPFHNAHLMTVQRALQLSKKVIIACGSSFAARSLRNPFTFSERQLMILSSFTPAQRQRLDVVALRDAPYEDELWIARIKQIVAEQIANYSKIAIKIAIIGYEKDNTSTYLQWFADWDFIAMPKIADLDATSIRKSYFLENSDNCYRETTPPEVQNFLTSFQETQFFAQLQQEQHWLQQQRAAWQNVPYPPIFSTVDALVRHKGNILLIERGGFPGKGQWALPGGFINENEWLLDGCLRELYEETSLAIDANLMRQYLQQMTTFDQPQRSARGRVITNCFYFKLDSDIELPYTAAKDDAKRVFWWTIHQMRREDFFEDHYDIICKMIKINPN